MSIDIKTLPKIKPIYHKNGKKDYKIVQYSWDGKPLRGFDSTKEAVDWLIKNKKTKAQPATIKVFICNVVKSKKRTAYGYQWRYLKNVIGGE